MFFKRLFPSRDPLAAIRKALQQRRWADALAMGRELDPSALQPEASTELDTLLVAAGNGLGELNLAEGLACRRAGDEARAGEHFALAAGQAQSEDLRQRIQLAQKAALLQDDTDSPPAAEAVSCGSSCSSCGPQTSETLLPDEEPDATIRLDLILGTYPPEWSNRYREMNELFLNAFLRAHEGGDKEALSLFGKIPEQERNDLYYFERGALLARLGDKAGGIRDLLKALSIDPHHLLALETLVSLGPDEKTALALEERLLTMVQQGAAPVFAHGQLAVLQARRGELDGALEHGLQAVAAGWAEPATVHMVASLLERRGRIDEAETLWGKLGTGGCSGFNPALAEFWLRHGKHLGKALEAFKGALRQEPNNPRWALRIGQVYLAQGWRKEGLHLVQRALTDPDLPLELRQEGEALLSTKSEASS